ncbi:MAG: hypothetical protein IIA64_09245, partial [Planctomycetes bacterium]|nr:hypothetical protein [Planctomycetota bacterium]
RAEFETRLADLLVEAGRFAEAERILLDSYAKFRENRQEPPLQVRAGGLREALERLVKLYESWGKPDDAASYRKTRSENTPQ